MIVELKRKDEAHPPRRRMGFRFSEPESATFLPQVAAQQEQDE